MTQPPKMYVHCHSSCKVEQQVLLCNFITSLWHWSASFLTRRENIPFVCARDNHWHWPRVQDACMQFGLAWVMSEACVKAGWARSPFIRPCCYFWWQLCDQLRGPGVRWWAEMGLTQKRPEFGVSSAESAWGPSACPLSHCLKGVLVVGLGASRVKEQVNLPALKA